MTLQSLYYYSWYLINVYLIAPWLAIPPLARTGIRLIAAIAIGYVIARRLYGRYPKAAQLTSIGFSILVLFVLPFLAFASRDHNEQLQVWRDKQCQESRRENLLVDASAPIHVDGFLVATNYNDLLTKQQFKNFPDYHGLAILRESTYADMARKVLMEWRYSFVEFQMWPLTNSVGFYYSGILDADGDSWTGQRYRLYYLAPRGHPQCLKKSGAAAAPESRFRNPNTSDSQNSTFCLAMEIRNTPISRYRLAIADHSEPRKWAFDSQGFQIPAWTDVDMEMVDVVRLDNKSPVTRYGAFSKPGRESEFQRCGNPKEAERVLASALSPDPRREFLARTNWYEQSAVSRFYEYITTDPKALPIRDPLDASVAANGASALRDNDGQHCIESREKIANSSNKLVKISCTSPTPDSRAALHVIGIYQGTNGRETVEVEISDDSRPLVLAFSAGQKTQWKVTMKRGVQISKVLLGGGQQQSVSGIPPDTPIEVYTSEPSPCERCWQGPYKSIAESEGPSKDLKEITGLPLTSFQGVYSASKFSISPSGSGVQFTQTNQIGRKSQPRAKSGTAPALHVIGIHEGGEIRINVTDDSSPIILGLTAYNKTHWNVSIKDGVKILKVILGGYHAQQVSGLPPETLIETYTYDPSPCERCSRGEKYFYSYERPPEQLKEITGLDPTSFQGRYKGREFSIYPGMKRVDE